MIPPGHYQAIRQPRRARPRDRWILGAGIAILALLGVAVVISFTSVQRRSGHGCIDVSAATFIGGSNLYRCGTAARTLCATPTSAGLHNLAFRRSLSQACRQAGLPVPRVPTAS